MWEIGWTDEFGRWITSDEIDESGREDVRAALIVLREIGPKLGRPLVDTIKGSRHPNMKELRVQSKGRPFRILFAFDPERHAVLLIGGNKAGKSRFYEQMVARADALFDLHLTELSHAKKQKKQGRF